MLLRPQKQVGGAGMNREIIKLTVDTFKALCMTANTQKGKQTRAYYTKMDSVFFRYMESKNADITNKLEQLQSEVNASRSL